MMSPLGPICKGRCAGGQACWQGLPRSPEFEANGMEAEVAEMLLLAKLALP